MREFLLTTTKDGEVLGLSSLLEAVKPNTSVTFVNKKEYEAMLTQFAVAIRALRFYGFAYIEQHDLEKVLVPVPMDAAALQHVSSDQPLRNEVQLKLGKVARDALVAMKVSK